MDEDSLRDSLTARLKEVEGTDRVDIEILKRPRGGEIMARLGRGVNHQLRLDLLDQVPNAVTVSDIELTMCEVVAGTFQPFLVPAGIAGGAEELRAHVVVNAHDTPTPAVEVGHDLRTDEPVRPSDQNGAHKLACEREFLGMGFQYIPRPRARLLLRGRMDSSGTGTETETETGLGGICSLFSRF
jgi:hypothetical protein